MRASSHVHTTANGESDLGFEPLRVAAVRRGIGVILAPPCRAGPEFEEALPGIRGRF